MPSCLLRTPGKKNTRSHAGHRETVQGAIVQTDSAHRDAEHSPGRPREAVGCLESEGRVRYGQTGHLRSANEVSKGVAQACALLCEHTQQREHMDLTCSVNQKAKEEGMTTGFLEAAGLALCSIQPDKLALGHGFSLYVFPQGRKNYLTPNPVPSQSFILHAAISFLKLT